MTSSPDLIHELRASRPSAPAELRTRVRALAAKQPARSRSPWATWRFPIRRSVLVAVPAAAAVAIASAGILGLARSDSPQALRRDSAEKQTLETAVPDAGVSGARAAPDSAAPRAQRVSATLTLEVKDSGAVSKTAQDVLALTRSLGGYVVSSSVTTGEQGNASLTVRVPVDQVQDAVTRLSAMGRIVSQQVDIDDLQGTLDQLEKQEAAVRAQIAKLRARLATESLDPQTEAVLRARLQTLRQELAGLRSQIAATTSDAEMSTIQLTVVTPESSGAVVPASRIDRTIDEALNVLAWEGVVALGLLIVLAPLALVALAAWLGRRLYRRHEEERLLAT